MQRQRIMLGYLARPRLAATRYAPLPSVYNNYITTKAMAEQRALAADDAELSVAAIRPGHIYGPGDSMIAIILEVRAPCGL